MHKFVVCFLVLALFLYLNAATVILLNQDKIVVEQGIINESTGKYFTKRAILNIIHKSITDNYDILLKTKTLQQEKKK